MIREVVAHRSARQIDPRYPLAVEVNVVGSGVSRQVGFRQRVAACARPLQTARAGIGLDRAFAVAVVFVPRRPDLHGDEAVFGIVDVSGNVGQARTCSGAQHVPRNVIAGTDKPVLGTSRLGQAFRLALTGDSILLDKVSPGVDDVGSTPKVASRLCAHDAVERVIGKVLGACSVAKISDLEHVAIVANTRMEIVAETEDRLTSTTRCCSREVDWLETAVISVGCDNSL